MTTETEWTVEKLQQELLNVEKRGNFNYADIIPLWEKAKEKIENEEQAVSLYTTFIYLTRRHIQSQGSQDYSKVDELFKEAIEFIGECFGEEEFITEASAKLQKNYAYFLYTKMRTPEPARQIWSNLLEYESGPFAWIEAILLERAYGNIEHARLLFYNALEAVTFRPHDIFAAFVQFEREEGTREDLDRALECINAKAAEFNARAEQHQYFRQKQDRIHGKETQPKQPQQQRKGRPQKQQQNGREKRDGEGAAKPVKNRQQNQSNKNVRQKQPAGKQQNQRKMTTNKNDEKMAEEVEKAPAGTFQTSAAPIGPIIPGMAMETKEEEKIEEQQKIGPKMDEVQPQKMEMDDGMEEEEAEEKMAENVGEEDSTGGGRKRRRQISDESGKAAAAPFPYGTSLEKNKLYVRQLHFGCKAEELKEFFGRFGKVLDARIVTKWNGKSKGCAYVDFATDEEAGAAVMGADGAEIRGRKIAVFLSNPPQKRPRMEFGEASAEGGDGGQKLPKAEKEQKAPKKTLGQGSYGLFAPRSVATTSSAAAQRAGKGGRLALLPRSISKTTAAITDPSTSAQSSINSILSPMGAVTHGTEEMNLSTGGAQNKIGRNEDEKKEDTDNGGGGN